MIVFIAVNKYTQVNTYIQNINVPSYILALHTEINKISLTSLLITPTNSSIKYYYITQQSHISMISHMSIYTV